VVMNQELGINSRRREATVGSSQRLEQETLTNRFGLPVSSPRFVRGRRRSQRPKAGFHGIAHPCVLLLWCPDIPVPFRLPETRKAGLQGDRPSLFRCVFRTRRASSLRASNHSASYLTSRCSVCFFRNGLYFLRSKRPVCLALFLVVM